MKYHLFYFLVSFISIFLSWGCNEDELPSNNNIDLLFTNANLIDIRTTNGQSNFPNFDLSYIGQRMVYIGVFNEPIQVSNGTVENKDALVWEWHKGMGDENMITFADGQVLDTNFSLDHVSCLTQKQYYWGAWAWDETKRYIELSSSLEMFELEETEIPNLKFKNYVLTTDENDDGYFNANEEIVIKLTIENTSGVTGTGVRVTLKNLSIPNFPLTINYGNVEAHSEASKFIPFRTPASVALRDSVPVELFMDFNECLNTTDNFSFPITGKEVCLAQVTLERINVLPELLFWDPWSIVPPTNTNPDVYFQLIDFNGDTIYTSIFVDNVDPTPISGVTLTWPPVSPCVNLKLDETYRIAVYDDDWLALGAFQQPPDFVGDVSFRMEDYLTTCPTQISFSTSRLNLSFEVLWE